MDVPQDDVERISNLICSADSPVGIDAKKTHVLILHKLEGIERRLTALEARLAQPTHDSQREQEG